MGQLKYNIKERLSRLDRQQHEKMIKKLLAAIGPASRSTLYRWINTKAEDSFEIPYTMQVKIAALFGCTIDELAPEKKDVLP